MHRVRPASQWQKSISDSKNTKCTAMAAKIRGSGRRSRSVLSHANSDSKVYGRHCHTMYESVTPSRNLFQRTVNTMCCKLRSGIIMNCPRGPCNANIHASIQFLRYTRPRAMHRHLGLRRVPFPHMTKKIGTHHSRESIVQEALECNLDNTYLIDRISCATN